MARHFRRVRFNGSKRINDMKKIFGFILMVLGGIYASASPYSIIVAVVGLALFLHGTEESIIDQVVDCLQRDKSRDTLEENRKREIGLITETKAKQ